MEDKEQKNKEEADFSIDENATAEPVVEVTDKSEQKASRIQRFKRWYKTNKKKSIPLTILVLLLLLAAIPWTRYNSAGLVMTQTVALRVMDSTSNTPVSGAEVRVGPKKAVTNGSGWATLHDVKVGNRTALISKKHYKDSKSKVFVPILKQKKAPTIQLVATGRQVKIVATNLIDGNKLEGVDIKVSDIEAKTDESGTATVVLPAGTENAKAALSLNGYNTANVDVEVSNQTIQENVFKLTPSGKIYFLSKLSGKIDVVKTNLDGTERQVVLPGTGREENNNTVLLANRDWKYLALLARRDVGQPAKLYLIETATDKLTTIEEGKATLSLVGWTDNNFVYQVNSDAASEWQPKKFTLKSFNAGSKQRLLLDQNEAIGDSNGYGQEQFGSIYTVNNNVVYTKTWYKYGTYYYDTTALNGKASGLYSIRSDGKDKKVVKTMDAQTIAYISLQLRKPDEMYMTINQPNGTPLYFEYNGSSVKDSSADKVPTDAQSNTYLLSPSGNQTFWSELRDGKNTLFVGDERGSSSKEVTSLSDYRPYGWYSNDYLLVSKNNSELYIMPKALKKGLEPVKITDYHKPAQSFYDYGGL